MLYCAKQTVVESLLGLPFGNVVVESAVSLSKPQKGVSIGALVVATRQMPEADISSRLRNAMHTGSLASDLTSSLPHISFVQGNGGFDGVVPLGAVLKQPPGAPSGPTMILLVAGVGSGVVCLLAFVGVIVYRLRRRQRNRLPETLSLFVVDAGGSGTRD